VRRASAPPVHAGAGAEAGERAGSRSRASISAIPRSEFTPERVRGRTILLTTTNGTAAMLGAGSAGAGAVAALTNVSAVAGWALAQGRDGGALLGDDGRSRSRTRVCARAACLEVHRPAMRLSDAAVAAVGSAGNYATRIGTSGTRLDGPAGSSQGTSADVDASCGATSRTWCRSVEAAPSSPAPPASARPGTEGPRQKTSCDVIGALQRPDAAGATTESSPRTAGPRPRPSCGSHHGKARLGRRAQPATACGSHHGKARPGRRGPSAPRRPAARRGPGARFGRGRSPPGIRRGDLPIALTLCASSWFR